MASSDSSNDPSGDDARVPRGDEPGASTTPSDDGKGTIGLGDRIGGAAPDTNQGKAEPMPPTPGHADPAGTAPHTDPPAVPELGDMSAGMALSQIASPTVLPARSSAASGSLSDGPAPAVPSRTLPADERPTAGSSSASTAGGSGPEVPASRTTGTAHRAPGQQGETPDGESVESDTAAGAARMAPGGPDQTPPSQASPGDSRGVGVPHEQPAEGTSQEQGIVHGVKDPARGEV